MTQPRFLLPAVLPATPRRVYQAWLDGELHGAMTGGAATVEAARVGGAFTAWDGYIEGTILALEPGRRIVQSWRSSDFPEGTPASRLEVALTRAEGGTRVTIRHSEIPAGQGGSYLDGWSEHYLAPMLRFFRAEARRAAAGKRPRAAARPPGKKAARKAGAGRASAGRVARGKAGARRPLRAR